MYTLFNSICNRADVCHDSLNKILNIYREQLR
ncbi:unnamed protein product [Acanthoscelides obtectus]|uniref:Uncharacterized protein n=1 Tax=Acanthoscelides obtectus TaxID=200917 RepID=A0A9P0K5I7_ACAOB|nr:unnamed protein product [Acanthoscelides obtectus]CAK1626787.1 hypothetical protein AOBTE_LOCUS4075 [Acanthoscelides obtectus]